MAVLRALFSAGLAHLSKVIFGLVTIKMIAVYLGPEGLGKLGNFMSLITIVSSLAGGGILSGIVKYVAEYKTTPFRLIKFLSSSFVYTSYASILFFILGSVFARQISSIIFYDDKYWSIVVFFSFSQLFIAQSNLVIGVVNGVRDTALFAKISVIGYFLALPVTFFLIKTQSEYYAAIALVSGTLCVCIPSLFVGLNSKIRRLIRFKAEKKHTHHLLHFSLMLLASASLFPTSEIIIRRMISNDLGLHDVGIWQAVSRIGSANVSFFAVFLAYYYMPKISGLLSKIEIKKTAFYYIVFSAAALAFVFLFTALFKKEIIYLLLSKNFVDAENYILYQILGDSLKVIGYIFGFISVAKASTKLYISAEVLQSFGYVALTYFALRWESNIRSVFLAYIAICAIYLLCGFVGFLIYTKKAPTYEDGRYS